MATGRRDKRKAGQAPQYSAALRSVLVAVDLAPGSDRVIQRAALLPLADGARLILLHVVPARLPVSSARRAAADARKALGEATAALSGSLRGRVVVRRLVTIGVPAAEIARQAQTARAGLILVGRGGGRGLRDMFLGSTAERVIRLGQRPVLTVRLPARVPYGRPAAALDLDGTAARVMDLLLRLVPPQSRVTVIHAYATPFHGLLYPSLASDEVTDARAAFLRKARTDIAGLLAPVRPEHGDSPRWRLHLRHGDARDVIERAVTRSRPDLLAVGTHGRTGLRHAFLGTVAGDVLRSVDCDVLVVPPAAPQ